MLHTVTFRALAVAACGWLLVLDAPAREPAGSVRHVPSDSLPEAQHVQAMQSELLSLREASRKDAAAVAEMRAALEQAQSQRSTALLLASALAALLAAVLGAMAWRWYRLRRVERVARWFKANGMAPAGAEQAVAMPEGRVADSIATNPLPWMDLLELYRSLGRRGDFDRVRNEFPESLSSQVPDFGLLVPPASPNVGVDIDVTAPDDDFDSLPPLDLDLDTLQDGGPDSGRGRA